MDARGILAMELYDRRTAPKRHDTWFVYGLVDSQRPDKVRYVGITNDPRRRLSSHVSASIGKREPCHKSSWIRSVIESDGDILLGLFASGLARVSAAALEIEIIESYKRRGFSLTNTTAGGYGGMLGAVRDAETRLKIGIASKLRARSQITKDRLSETSRLAGPQENNSYGYKGVGFDIQRQKWNARITVDGKRIKIGRFPTPELAALAYDRAAFEAWGGNCFLNFPVAMTASQENTVHG